MCWFSPRKKNKVVVEVYKENEFIIEDSTITQYVLNS